MSDQGAMLAEDLARIAALEAELRELRARVGIPSVPDRVARLLGDPRILENLPDYVSVVDRDFRIVYVNRVRIAARRQDVVGQSVFDHVAPELRDRFRDALVGVLRDGGELDFEFVSNLGYHFLTHFIPVFEDGVVAFVLTVSADITEARLAEAALRDSESRLRHAIRASGMGTWSWFAGDALVVWDDALRRIFGEEGTQPITYEAYLARIVEEDRPAVVETIERALATGVYRDVEHRIRRADGLERRVLCKGDVVRDVAGAIVGLRGGVFDVTERHHLEQQVQRARKMEAVGRLTSGIAHNFNNLLGIILPSVELGRRHANPQVAARLDDIEHAALRAHEMVRELMLFARGSGRVERRRVDLVALAARTVSICRTTFGPTVRVELSVAPGVPNVAANANQLEQVLLNVLINARDALEDGAVAMPSIVVQIFVRTPGYVTIRVEDNGRGMDEATRANVFEPFFTTKDGARGTGLGLSSAYAIVLEHLGRIECESRLGEGTAIVVELPAADESVPGDAPAPAPRATEGTERILIVDDEDGMRRVVRGLLEQAGYVVEEFARGVDLLDRLESGDPPPDLVLADRTMPGLAGDALLAEIARRTRAPIVVLSGDPARTTSEHARAEIAKPVQSATLLGVVRGVIDG